MLQQSWSEHGWLVVSRSILDVVLVTSNSSSVRICCQCNNHMNPANAPEACSICRNHKKCARCYVYPGTRPRSSPDQHLVARQTPFGDDFFSLHENHSVKITLRIVGDDAAPWSERGESSPYSTKPGYKRPAAQPNVSGWW